MSGAPQLLRTKPKRRCRRAAGAEVEEARARRRSFPAKEDAVVVCLDNLVFMRSLPDASMKLIVTSPPYNMGKEYETKNVLSMPTCGRNVKA